MEFRANRDELMFYIFYRARYNDFFKSVCRIIFKDGYSKLTDNQKEVIWNYFQRYKKSIDEKKFIKK